MDTKSRYPLERQFILNGKLVWFMVYSDTQMDMVRRDMTGEEREIHAKAINFDEV